MQYTRFSRISILLLSVLGLAVSGYLAYAYLTDTPVRCTGGFFGGCVEVQKSEYAKLLGIPIPLFGLGFYLFLAIDALVLTKLHERYSPWRTLVWMVTLVGFLFSAYLSFLEAFVIEAWCVWCVASATLSTLIFIVACFDFFRHPKTVERSP